MARREDEDDRLWSERFRSLAEATATEVFVNAPDGRLLSDLPRWQSITGQTREETEGFGWLDAVHPDDFAHVERTWREAVATGTVFDSEYRIRRAAGGWIHVWVRSAPLRDEHGEIVQYVGLYHDVTERVERRRREQALEQALDRETQIVERIVAQTPIGVAILWGSEHRFRLVNEAFEAIIPAGREVVGRAVAEALPEASELFELLDRARAGETVDLPEVSIDFGGLRYYRAVYAPIREGDGSPGGVLATVIETTEDVRRRRELERDLEREREVAETLQRTLLPSALPEVPGVELCARYEPARGGAFVGGDWYDVFDAGDGRVAVAVGDVAGRGLAAATVMGQLRAALRAYAVDDPSPAAVLARMDELVDRVGGSATLAYGLMTPASGLLLQGLAGHPPPLLVGGNDGEAEWLDRGRGTPLGAPAASRQTAELLVPGGGLLLYYTDGLLQERELGIQAGLETLRVAAARAGAGRPQLAAVCSTLLDVDAGTDDDRALLAVRRAAEPGSSPSR